MGPRANTAPSRQEEILAAAARLFATRGYHGVGIDDIGSAVGVSGPALYRYFASKETILARMLVDISERLLAGGAQRVERIGTAAAADPLAALRALVAFHVQFALDHPELITVHDRDLDNVEAEQRRRVRRLQRGYVEIWVRALGAYRPELAEQTARAAVHAVLGLLNSTPHSLRLERPAMAALLERMALAALGAG